MPKVTEAHREARRHEIARAALRCFTRKGFQATSIADIIAESGLSAGAIYGHYKSKDELIELAVSEVLDTRFQEIDRARATAPLLTPGELIERIVTGLTAQLGDLSLLVQIWAEAAVTPALRPSIDRVRAWISEMITSYLRQWFSVGLGMDEDAAAIDAERFAALYVGILQGYVLQSTVFGPFDGESYLAAVTAIRPGG